MGLGSPYPMGIYPLPSGAALQRGAKEKKPLELGKTALAHIELQCAAVNLTVSLVRERSRPLGLRSSEVAERYLRER
jgi:hypothetical protein